MSKLQELLFRYNQWLIEHSSRKLISVDAKLHLQAFNYISPYFIGLFVGFLIVNDYVITNKVILLKTNVISLIIIVIISATSNAWVDSFPCDVLCDLSCTIVLEAHWTFDKKSRDSLWRRAKNIVLARLRVGFLLWFEWTSRCHTWHAHVPVLPANRKDVLLSFFKSLLISLVGCFQLKIHDRVPCFHCGK